LLRQIFDSKKFKMEEQMEDEDNTLELDDVESLTLDE
jgi:hypothetical protein